MKISPTHTIVGQGTYVDLSSFGSIAEHTYSDPGFFLQSLCRIPRFAGAGDRFYSVAQHSFLVAELVEQRCRSDSFRSEAKLHAFLHDAHEAYLGDIPHPVAQLLASDLPEFTARLSDVKEDIQSAIYSGLELQRPDAETLAAIALADKQALAIEAGILFLTHAQIWPQLQGVPVLSLRPTFLSELFSLNTTRKRGRKAIFNYYNQLNKDASLL